MTPYALLLLLVIGDEVTAPKPVELSRHATREACVLAARNERAKPWPDQATVRVVWCRDMREGA